MFAKLRPSTAFIAALLQILGLVAVAVGAGLAAGVAVGVLVGGVLALALGVALEKGGSNARKPST